MVAASRQPDALSAPPDLRREIDALYYAIGHDLRAPLRAIEGFSRALDDDYSGRLDATGRDYLARIRAAGAKLGVMLDGLLQLAHVAAVPFEPTTVDLSELASEITARLAGAAAADVQVSIEPGLRARGDPVLLSIALGHLLENAFKFSRPRRPAVVAFGEADVGGRRAFFVRDNGVGFDMSQADRLFTIFRRLHAAEEFSGAGIGLACVSRVIQRHDGRVWAVSRPGAGATFYFTLWERQA